MLLQSSHSGLSSLMSLGDLGDTATNVIAQGGGITAGLFSALPFAAAACPLCAPFIALGASLAGLFGSMFKGCGSTCTLTSDEANKVEQVLQQNLSAYQSGQHTYDEQQSALEVFDYAWGQLVAYCGQPSMGAAGGRCVSERQAGGCASWQCNNPAATHNGPNGTCCGSDWFALYRDPIANDPHVQPAADASTSSFSPGSSDVGAVGSSTTAPNFLLWGGLALIAVLAIGGD